MIYFDNAATTYPKPIRVSEEIRKCVRLYGGNPGRGAHSLSLEAARRVYDCRARLCEFFSADEADRVFFTLNTTMGINTVLKGTLRDGDHVIISDMEHNALWRPVWRLAKEGRVEYSVFKTMTGEARQTPWRICAEIAKHLRKNTRAVFCIHTSNICSMTLPISEIGAFCKKHGLLFAVDAAQSAGHERINMREMGIDALCVPGHKGLYGPQGVGAVLLGQEIVLDTLTEGGNGVDSFAPEMSLYSPERYEAGTLPTPAIAGLYEGLESLEEIGLEEIAAKERAVQRRVRELLGNTEGVELYAAEYDGSIVLFNISGIPSERVASALDGYGICVRGGYHCAPLAHKTLGTPEGGAVRVSVGMFNTPTEADALWRAVKNIQKG